MEIILDNLRQPEGIIEDIAPLEKVLEQKFNLAQQVDNNAAPSFPHIKVMRICLLVGLSLKGERKSSDYESILLNRNNQHYVPSFLTKDNLKPLVAGLLKLRYKDVDIDWRDFVTVSRIVAFEMRHGLQYLMEENNLNSFLFYATGKKGASSGIPALDLVIGHYPDELEAKLNINGKGIQNSQILVAGTTGSGKTNLLAILIEQFRTLSTDTPYPVNFLLFDYKGEFSDPQNNHWLDIFEVNRSCIWDPVQRPIPFTPFKDFTGHPINEINLYSTEMAEALCAVDRTTISANMSNRLSEAIVEAYKKTKGAPITFQAMLTEYQAKLQKDKDDSVTSVLKQLVRNKIFDTEDRVNLIDESHIIKMDAFPKDGPLAKAIVYFVISKLNNIYEVLPQQARDDERVQIRHFTIIDEAHYMLDFDNHPLRNLIAVGRNKGLSIILATQNMDSFKSKYFDFYANAQYPLIMKQQSINDSVIKDLFGVTGKDFQDIKSDIATLQKGELIIKDDTMRLLGLDTKNYKKIKVNHLI